MTKLIAVIDDEAEMEFIYLMLLDKLLANSLVSMKFFHNCSSFLDWLATNRPDLILTDINMPVMSGLELIRKIRSEGRRIPAYFVSGYEEKEYRAEMNELGVCRFLAKPLNQALVLEQLSLDLNLEPANM